MNAVAANRVLSDAKQASNDSFYHLRGADVRQMRCSGTACFVARHLKPNEWDATQQQSNPVHCLGCCYASPAHGRCSERPAIECPATEPIVLARILKGGARTLEEYRRLGGFRALPEALKRPSIEVIEAVEAAALRGRGGAAFPTAQKWWSAATQSTPEKFVIANGDEGDPGAYIDRFLMEDDPFSVLEGMALAAYAVGAREGWIYVRKEYPDAAFAMRRAIAEAKRVGFLGKGILGADFGFEVEVLSGNGSYLCGEETALIRSIEGLRPEPRAKPPFSSTNGLWGKPTVMNNIETLVNVPWIVLNSGPAFRAMGFSKSRGTKVISLNSLFRRPGLYEVEFGITVRDIVEELGGGMRDGDIEGLIIGGPLAGIIPPSLFNTPFGFEELQSIGASVGHGGVIALDDHTSLPELIHHVFSFGAFESCGKCAPCRLGARRIETIFNAIASGKCGSAELNEFRSVISAMKLGSLCAHGLGLAEFGESVLRHYGKELTACFK